MAHASIGLECGVLMEKIGEGQVVKGACTALPRRLDFTPKSQEYFDQGES